MCPRPRKQELIGHDVWHVADMGWPSKRNSELLRLMAAEHFDAFLTVDQNLEFQQNLQVSGVGVIVALAKSIASRSSDLLCLRFSTRFVA